MRLGPFVDARSTGPLCARCADEARFATCEVTENTLGVQRVAAEVHQGSAGQVE